MARAAPVAGSHPLVVAVLAVAFLGEPITPMLIVGVMIIGVGVWGSQLTHRDAFVGEVRATLGEDAYAAAHRDGCALDYNDALDTALRAG